MSKDAEKKMKKSKIVRLYRLSPWFYVKKVSLLPAIVRAIIRVVYTCQIDYRAEIGKPVTFGHGFCVVLGNCKIGKNADVGFFTQIASGTTMGDNFFIGLGTRIIKAVKIGDNVKIGANAVVLKDVPDSTLAVGVPAVYKNIGKGK